MFTFFIVAISTASLLVVSATMLARANDLRWRKGWHWNVRFVGFVLAGVMPIGIIGYDYATSTMPSLYECLFRFGVGLVFLTTPYLPPWWKWISGIDENEPVNSDNRRKPQ